MITSSALYVLFLLVLLSSNGCFGEIRNPSATTASPPPTIKTGELLSRNSKQSRQCRETIATPRSALLSEIKTCTGRNSHESSSSLEVDSSTGSTSIVCAIPGRGTEDIESAIQDFSGSENRVRGLTAWNFLQGIAKSETFVREFWQKRPFLLRSQDCGGWAAGSFTVEKDLRLMDGSFITGFQTAEVLRNGTKTDTWALAPLKDNPAQRTAWSDIEKALDGGTIYFNTAGSLWRNVGGLCRLMGYAFGLPPNTNIYVTPPGE